MKHHLRVLQALLLTVLFCACSEKEEATTVSRKPTSDLTNASVEPPEVFSDISGNITNAVATNALSGDGKLEGVRRLTMEVTGKDISSGKTVSDGEGQPVSAIFPDGSRVFFQSSRPVALLAPSGSRTVYEYDPEGRLRTIIHPDGRRETKGE